MPFKYSDYPENWKSEIVPSILIRAGGLESHPQVGACRKNCGVRNYSSVLRNPDDKSEILAGLAWDSYADARHAAGWFNENAQEKWEKWIVIVLTIAHWDDPDTMNCDPDNLKAACQRCHNVLDIYHRKSNTRKRKLREEIARGQLLLFDVEV